jgi:hypothetical protein
MLWIRISIRASCTTLCDKVYQWLATGQWFSPGPPVSSTNKTDHYDITEILFEVALNNITLTPLCQSRVIVGNPQLITFRLLSNSSWLHFVSSSPGRFTPKNCIIWLHFTNTGSQLPIQQKQYFSNTSVWSLHFTTHALWVVYPNAYSAIYTISVKRFLYGVSTIERSQEDFNILVIDPLNMF